MRRYIRLLLALVIWMLVELGIYKIYFKDIDHARLLHTVFLVFLVFGIMGLYTTVTLSSRPAIQRPTYARLFTSIFFGVVVQRIILLLLSPLIFFFSWVLPGDYFSWVILGFIALSSILLCLLVWGSICGTYRYKVEHISIPFTDLPASFDGLKVVQISDIHSGTWDSVSGVRRGVDMIKDLNPDLILFTGDLVNADKDEINPFMDLFAELKAPLGKYAVLGNHDYYGQPLDKALRPAYYAAFFQKYEDMGFHLLNNAHHIITRGSQQIAIIGVENWGTGRYFPKRGDLEVATTSLPRDIFSILLSHDPSHWQEKVKSFHRRMSLTLSGHTHAMQFGINLPFFKWSPIQYRYRHWMGLYEDSGRYLYVNRGFGVLAYPGRVGMCPEITCITLRTAT